MTPDPTTLLGGETLDGGLERLWQLVQPHETVPGWATVDLDRAESEVADALRSRGQPAVEPRPDDAILGARCRILQYADGDVLLLEPSTEGRLAASLARYGEGNVVLYLAVEGAAVTQARAAGIPLSAEAGGPLGRERLVGRGPAWGPHLVLVLPAAPPGPTDAQGGPATIER